MLVWNSQFTEFYIEKFIFYNMLPFSANRRKNAYDVELSERMEYDASVLSSQYISTFPKSLSTFFIQIATRHYFARIKTIRYEDI